MHSLFDICISPDCKEEATPDGKYVFNVFRDHTGDYFCIGLGRIDPVNNTINWFDNCINLRINNELVAAQDFRFKLIPVNVSKDPAAPSSYKMVLFYTDFVNNSINSLIGDVTVKGEKQPVFSWGNIQDWGIIPDNFYYDMDCSNIDNDNKCCLVFAYKDSINKSGTLYYRISTVNPDNSLAPAKVWSFKDGQSNDIAAGDGSFNIHISKDGKKVVAAFTGIDGNVNIVAGSIYKSSYYNYPEIMAADPSQTGFSGSVFDTRISDGADKIAIEGISGGSVFYNTGAINW